MENEEDIIKTIHQIHKLKPHYVFPSLAVPFPGTELFNIAVQNGMNGDIWLKYAKGEIQIPPICLSKKIKPLSYLYYFNKIYFHFPSLSLVNWLVANNIKLLLPNFSSLAKRKFESISPFIENFFRYFHLFLTG